MSGLVPRFRWWPSSRRLTPWSLFSAWRSRWVLLEEAQYKFYRLGDELTYYIAASQPGQLDESKLRSMFDEYQQIWDQLSNR